MKAEFKFERNGVIMRLALSDSEFRRRVKNGKLKMRSAISGKPKTWTLVGKSPPPTVGNYAGNWPCTNSNVGVESFQRKAAMAEAARIGVPTEFNEDGDAVFTSAQHRKRYCEAIGYMQLGRRGGGDSDPQRLSQRELEIRAMAGNAVRKTDDDGALTMRRPEEILQARERRR